MGSAAIPRPAHLVWREACYGTEGAAAQAGCAGAQHVRRNAGHWERQRRGTAGRCGAFRLARTQIKPDVLDFRRREAELLFRRIGITFAVHGDPEAQERLIHSTPFRAFFPQRNGLIYRIEPGEPYFTDLRERWSAALRAAHIGIPRPPYGRRA